MEYKVKLASFPVGVAFSERLRERCCYNAERGELSYRGFMTKCAYDEISSLSDDLDYHRAVEHLFVLTSAEIAPQQRSFPLAAALGAAAMAAVVGVVIFIGMWKLGGNQRLAAPPENATAAAGS